MQLDLPFVSPLVRSQDVYLARGDGVGLDAVLLGVWATVILVLVMAIAASKLTRHSLALLAVAATIAALVWFYRAALLIGLLTLRPTVMGPVQV